MDESKISTHRKDMIKEIRYKIQYNAEKYNSSSEESITETTTTTNNKFYAILQNDSKYSNNSSGVIWC